MHEIRFKKYHFFFLLTILIFYDKTVFISLYYCSIKKINAIRILYSAKHFIHLFY